MFSHVVIFWTDPSNPQAADKLVEGAQKLLSDIPGVQNFHVGKMVPGDRPIIDQSYQVALNIQVADREAEQAYQKHPQHVEFVENYFKPLCTKLIVYDFA